MAVMTQTVMPISYEQYKALEKQMGPVLQVPPGLVVHMVSRHDGGTMVTDVWQDEASAMAFYQVAAAKSGAALPPLSFTEVLEIYPQLDA